MMYLITTYGDGFCCASASGNGQGEPLAYRESHKSGAPSYYMSWIEASQGPEYNGTTSYFGPWRPAYHPATKPFLVATGEYNTDCQLLEVLGLCT